MIHNITNFHKYAESIINTVHEPLIVLDKDLRVVEVSRSFYEFFKVTPEETLGKHIYDLGNKQWDIPKLRELLETILPLRATLDDYEIEHDFATIGRRIMLLNARQIHGVLGEDPIILLAIEDITGRKNDELALQEGREKSILNVFPDGIAITDLSGRIFMVSPMALTMFGYEREEEMLGHLITDFIAPGDRERASSKFALMSHGNIKQLGEYRGLRADGSTFEEEVTVNIIQGIDRRPDRMVFVIRDITERKELESRLRQAQKMEAVGRLAGGVAHDFNNMLSIIIGYADLALMKIDPADKLATEIKKILVAGQKSADLTRQLLAFARKQIIAPKLLNLNDIVDNMIKLLERLIGEEIELHWKPSANLMPVVMDPSQIDQILANLVLNARDAIQGVGKIIIETETAMLDEAYCAIHPGLVPGRYVLLAVSDNGKGMDKATQERIFEPFFTTKEIGKGTGLGLATLFGIVKQNNGLIEIKSEPGKGSSFKIYLPAHESWHEGWIKPVHVNVPTGKETVLVVEDEKALLELILIMFEELGYTVCGASSPIQAIQMVDGFTEDIHLLLTDIMMPEMSGPELWRKASSMRPGMKCLYMSGYTGKFIAEHGLLEDGIQFISKPFSKELLAVRIREALDG
jgi:two-component system, cell cycle sensor histidine kinase and response regulator CckA